MRKFRLPGRLLNFLAVVANERTMNAVPGLPCKPMFGAKILESTEEQKKSPQ